VQAGGNCGVYPLELSRHFSQVYTFEPDSHNFECLLINCRGVENIQARCAALADKECTVALQLNPNNCGSHHVSGSGTIPALTIDSLKLDACDLIALDVEGYEWPALQGAYRTLDLFHPTLILETKKHGERYGYKSDQMRDWVKERGYTYRDKVGRDEIWS
jgi:FkbM family methyltransferase